jgi:hypothetical protein
MTFKNLDRSEDEVYQRMLELHAQGGIVGKGRGKLSNELGASEGRISRRLKWMIEDGLVTKLELLDKSGQSNPVSKAEEVDGAVSTEEFIEPYDFESRVHEVVKTLDGRVIEDDDLRKYIGLGETRWRSLRDKSEFKKYQIYVYGKGGARRRIWGCPKELDKCRQRITITEEV